MGIDVTALESMSEDAIDEVLESWTGFCDCTECLLASDSSTGESIIGDVKMRFASFIRVLCSNNLTSLVLDHFLHAVEERFKLIVVGKVWKDFDATFSAGVLQNCKEDWSEKILKRTLKGITLLKSYQESCIDTLLHSLQQHVEKRSISYIPDIDRSCILSKYQLMVFSTLLTSLPSRFPEVLCSYFSQQLENLSRLVSVADSEEDAIQNNGCSNDNEDKLPAVFGYKGVDGSHGMHKETVAANNNQHVCDIGMVVNDLRNIGFSSLSEDAYASAIFSLLKDQTKIHDLTGEDYHIPVIESIEEWIKVVALPFLNSLLAYLGDGADMAYCVLNSPLALQHLGNSISSEGLVRWQLRLEYFAYEMLQDLRIGKLFEIIVDYPDSSPAIDDLKKCLEYTGQYSKLVDSFISSLRYRLLTAGASTNDILHQYVSTIKVLRMVDPSGVFLEAVTEPIRDYLRGRKDTIKCIVTMLTDGTGGNSSGAGNNGDSLLEELNRDDENKECVAYGNEYDTDNKQDWPNAECWEPDPVAAGPLRGGSSRRKLDILGMMVGIIGSKDQLVNEYRVMLAERLLNKSGYDIDSDIRTLELLKIHFGESSMQKCDIMLNDIIDSKRTNTNIKASVSQPYPIAIDENNNNATLDILDATIISSNFWPTIQVESFNIPNAIDTIICDYTKRYNAIKAPRKLLWYQNLGSVKLELQFGDRSLQFTVAPVHAVIILKFQEQKSWNSKDLANVTGIPVDTLKKRITFWISKGIIAESHGAEAEEHIFTVVEETVDMNRNDIGIGTCEGLLANDDERESSVASVEEQLQKEMTIYEKFIIGMLTNFGSMAVERIHNTLKMFCIAEPSYDKSLQQLQSFLSCLVSEEKIDIRDGLYFLRK